MIAMDASYWHEKWAEDRIGFHQDRPNRRLVEHWPALDLAPGTPVFVPLAGKSLDMLWLHERGHPVLGVELSEKAVRAFFDENALAHERRPDGPFERFSGTGDATGIELLVGDFFALTADDLAGVGALYDRASLIAMDDGFRARYAAHLGAIVPSGTHAASCSRSTTIRRGWTVRRSPCPTPSRESSSSPPSTSTSSPTTADTRARATSTGGASTCSRSASTDSTDGPTAPHRCSPTRGADSGRRPRPCRPARPPRPSRHARGRRGPAGYACATPAPTPLMRGAPLTAPSDPPMPKPLQRIIGFLILFATVGQVSCQALIAQGPVLLG